LRTTWLQGNYYTNLLYFHLFIVKKKMPLPTNTLRRKVISQKIEQAIIFTNNRSSPRKPVPRRLHSLLKRHKMKNQSQSHKPSRLKQQQWKGREASKPHKDLCFSVFRTTVRKEKKKCKICKCKAQDR